MLSFCFPNDQLTQLAWFTSQSFQTIHNDLLKQKQPIRAHELGNTFSRKFHGHIFPRQGEGGLETFFSIIYYTSRLPKLVNYGINHLIILSPPWCSLLQGWWKIPLRWRPTKWSWFAKCVSLEIELEVSCYFASIKIIWIFFFFHSVSLKTDCIYVFN